MMHRHYCEILWKNDIINNSIKDGDFASPPYMFPRSIYTKRQLKHSSFYINLSATTKKLSTRNYYHCPEISVMMQ